MRRRPPRPILLCLYDLRASGVRPTRTPTAFVSLLPCGPFCTALLFAPFVCASTFAPRERRQRRFPALPVAPIVYLTRLRTRLPLFRHLNRIPTRVLFSIIKVYTLTLFLDGAGDEALDHIECL